MREQIKRLLAAVLAVGVLSGAAAAPARAAIDPELMADILNETETENRGRISMAPGETRDLAGMLRGRDYDDDDNVLWTLQSVVWTSSYDPVVTVDAQGVATAHKAGVARVTATSYDNTGRRRKQTITVGVQSGAHSDVLASTDLASFTVSEGKRIGMAALLDPAGEKSIRWTSSNPAIAEVAADGLMTANSIGRCTLTASWTEADGAARQETIAVRVASGLLTDVQREIQITLRAGQRLDLAALYFPTYASSSLRDYSLNLGSNGVITAEGLTVTAAKAGSGLAIIYEKDGFLTASVQRFALTVTD